MTNQPILIIDDSLNDGEFAKIILQESGFNGVISTTRLSDAIDILRADDTIKRVVLDLGGLVRKSDNPLAALNVLEAENFPDLQIVVLTGNRNPALVREIEQRGYQCLTKQNALDLVEKSSALPDAIANLGAPSCVNLRQNIHVNELFARVSRLEAQIDGILLLSGASNLQSLANDVKFIESQLIILYELKNRVTEFQASSKIIHDEFGELQSESKVINTEKNIELLILLGKAIWLLRLNKKLCDLGVFMFTEIKNMILEKLKLIFFGSIAAIIVTSPLFKDVINELPKIQAKFKTAIEYLFR